MNAAESLLKTSLLRRRILSRVRKRVPKVFKPKALAKIKPKDIEKAVDEVLKGITAFDLVLIKEQGQKWCAKCGECCRKNDPIMVSTEDLLNIASFLGIHLRTVIANYAKPIQDGTFSLRAKPCIFLQGNRCTIYPARPLVCRIFPLKAKRDYITLGLYEYCSFSLNFVVHKAIALLNRYLIELESPEVKLPMQKYMKQLERIMPKDQAGQLVLAQQLYRTLEKLYLKRKEEGYPAQTSGMKARGSGSVGGGGQPT